MMAALGEQDPGVVLDHAGGGNGRNEASRSGPATMSGAPDPRGVAVLPARRSAADLARQPGGVPGPRRAEGGLARSHLTATTGIQPVMASAAGIALAGLAFYPRSVLLVSPGPNHCLHGIPSGWSHDAPFAVRRPAHRLRHALASRRSGGAVMSGPVFRRPRFSCCVCPRVWPGRVREKRWSTRPGTGRG
jgi:hypothetical protein